jgi:hypothetical protein
MGDRPIARNTPAAYRWQIDHLVRFFGRYRLDEIDTDLCRRFKAHKLAEAQELRDAIAAVAVIRHRRGQRVRPLSLRSIRMQIVTLTAILDEAIEDRHITANPRSQFGDPGVRAEPSEQFTPPRHPGGHARAGAYERHELPRPRLSGQAAGDLVLRRRELRPRIAGSHVPPNTLRGAVRP